MAEDRTLPASDNLRLAAGCSARHNPALDVARTRRKPGPCHRHRDRDKAGSPPTKPDRSSDRPDFVEPTRRSGETTRRRWRNEYHDAKLIRRGTPSAARSAFLVDAWGHRSEAGPLRKAMKPRDTHACKTATTSPSRVRRWRATVDGCSPPDGLAPRGWRQREQVGPLRARVRLSPCVSPPAAPNAATGWFIGPTTSRATTSSRDNWRRALRGR